MDDPVWDASTFSKNRDRLLKKKVAKRFFQEVLKQARERNLLSDEHFTVDGTLIEAWASLKSFQRKEQEKQENGDEEKDRGNANVNFRGEKRSNQTHESKTDPDAKLARKGDGKEAKLSYNGNLLVENRNGLIVDATVLEATGTAERDAALVAFNNPTMLSQAHQLSQRRSQCSNSASSFRLFPRRCLGEQSGGRGDKQR